MAGKLATQIEQTEQRIAALECSLRAYRSFPAAAAKVAAQLDEAYRALAGLEAGR